MGGNSTVLLKKKPGEKTHLLIIRLSALGDVAMTVPVLRNLVQRYPQLRITMLSKPFFKPLFNGIPNLEFYGAEVQGKHKGVPGLWKLSAELADLQVDAVADLHNVLRSNVLRIFFKLKGIPVAQIDKGRKEKRALTRKTGKIFKPLKSMHQRYADVFEALGFPLKLSDPAVPPKPELTPEISKVLGTDGIKWIGIAPFAAYPGKTYPPELMKEVIAGLNAAGTYKILLFGGGERETEQLKILAMAYENAVTTAGVFSLEQQLRIISNLDLMVAMDSGNAHLAAMYGIKTVTLWGITHPFAGFSPFGQPEDYTLQADREAYPLIPTSIYGNTCPEGYEAAIGSIPPERVLATIREIV